MSLRAYAKRVGVSVAAVSRAVKSGRLRASLTPDGKIADAALADAEWAANTRADRRPLTGRGAKPSQPAEVTPGKTPDYGESRARREAAEAALAELELAKEQAKLVDAAEIERRIADDYGKVRVKLLGVPSAARQRDPTLTAAHLALFDALVRSALEDLASGG